MDPNIPAQATTPEIQTPVAEPVPSVPSNPSSKTKYIIFGVLILFILIILGGGTYYLGVAKQQSIMQKNNKVVTATVTPSETPISSLTPIPSSSSNPTLTSAPTTDPTINWKTYANTKYEFSFKYPPNFFVDEQDNQDPGAEIDSIFVTNFSSSDLFSSPPRKNPSDSDVFQMNIYYDRRINTDLQTEKSLNYRDTSVLHNTFSDYSVGGEPGFKFVQTATLSTVFGVITVHNHKVFSFSLRNETPEFNRTFDQILSTFKFTQ